MIDFIKSSLLVFFLTQGVSMLTSTFVRAQPFVTTYNNKSYQSNQPHNLNVYYFKAADLPLDTSYLRRHSQMLLWLQQYYRQQMQANGYGSKTFGLWASSATGDSVRIIVINGRKPLNAYRNTNPGGNDSLIQEYRDFKNAHPQYQLSEHSLVLIATPGANQMNGLPYYGIGKTCLATDYSQLDLQYMGQSSAVGQLFVTYFGGIAHELGHALNLPHSHQTLSENQNPAQGTNLMADGNYTLTASPTFINRAGAAILNRCQLFNTQSATSFYTGHVAGLLSLYSQWGSGTWTISGRFLSNVPVTDINIYQDPFQSPSAGYQRVAFSAAPVGPVNDSFRIVMPVAEVMQGSSQYPPTGPWNLAIELVLENGETEERWFPFNYTNRQPSSGFTFDDLHCASIPPNFTLTQIGRAFSPGQACFRNNDSSLVMRTWASGPGDSQDNQPFLWRAFAHGDTISMRVLEITDTWNDQIGLMVRASLDSNSPYAAISALDDRGVFWTWRSQTGQLSNYHVVTTLALPFWIKLVRTGNWIDGYYSSSGQNWTMYYRSNFSMPTQAFAGVFIGKNGARGKVDQIKLNGITVDTHNKLTANLLSIYPNPFNELIEINNKQSENPITEIRLMDVQGIPHFTTKLTNTQELIQIQPTLANPGMYWMELTFQNGMKRIEKMVKR